MKEYSSITPAEFAEATERQQPFVLRANGKPFGGVSHWTPEFFNTCGYAENNVRVSAGDNPYSSTATHKTPVPYQAMTLGDFTQKAFLEPNEDARYYYLIESLTNLPKLREELSVPAFVPQDKVAFSFLWMSPRGLITRLHFDIFESFFFQLKGRKKFVLFPPALRRYYPNPFWGIAGFISRVQMDDLDARRFRRFDRSQGEEVILEEGDCIYLPHCWWHQVYSEADYNVSVNFWWYQDWVHIAQCWPQYAWTFPLFLRKLYAGQLARLKFRR